MASCEPAPAWRDDGDVNAMPHTDRRDRVARLRNHDAAAQRTTAPRAHILWPSSRRRRSLVIGRLPR